MYPSLQYTLSKVAKVLMSVETSAQLTMAKRYCKRLRIQCKRGISRADYGMQAWQTGEELKTYIKKMVAKTETRLGICHDTK